MFCNKCNTQLIDGAMFCPNCGAPVEQQPNSFVPPVPPYAPPYGADGTIVSRYTALFSHPLYLAMCILISASTLFSFASNVSGGGFNLPVLEILFTVFMWRTFASAKQGAVSAAHMRCVSGTVYASMICLFVVVGVAALAAVVGLFAGMFTGNVFTEIFEEIIYNYNLPSSYYLRDIPSELFQWIGIIIAVALIIAAVLIFILAWFGYRNMHRLAKSMYQSVMNGFEQLDQLGTARGWILAMGILECVSALGSISDFTAFLSTGCSAALWIVAYVWLGNFVQKNPV